MCSRVTPVARRALDYRQEIDGCQMLDGRPLRQGQTALISCSRGRRARISIVLNFSLGDACRSRADFSLKAGNLHRRTSSATGHSASADFPHRTTTSDNRSRSTVDTGAGSLVRVGSPLCERRESNVVRQCFPFAWSTKQHIYPAHEM